MFIVSMYGEVASEMMFGEVLGAYRHSSDAFRKVQTYNDVSEMREMCGETMHRESMLQDMFVSEDGKCVYEETRRYTNDSCDVSATLVFNITEVDVK